MTIRVLIADDHAVVRQGLTMFLALDPEIELVGEAKDGADALKKAHALRPDVVLMDLMMPVMNGVEAARTLKSEPQTASVPIIAMSAGFILRESIDDLLADSIISKPFDLDALIANIRSTLRRANPEASD